MLQVKTNIRLLALCSLLFLISCGDSANTADKNDNDTTTVSSTQDTATTASSMPMYDPSMDPYLIGGEGTKKLGDSLGIKVYEFAARPGESWKLHTHPDHTAYVLQGGKIALYNKAAGRQDTLTFPTGMALISGPLTDSGKNVGNTTVKFVVVDIYRPRSK